MYVIEVTMKLDFIHIQIYMQIKKNLDLCSWLGLYKLFQNSNLELFVIR
jgi:hypothetical protein